MLKFRYLVLVLAILAVVSSTIAEEKRDCYVEVDDGEEMHSKIAELAMTCLAAETHFRAVQALEEFRSYSKLYCGRRVQYQTCIDNVTLLSESCQNETRHQIFLVLKELLETTLEVVCQDEGDILTSILHGYYTFPDNSKEDKSVMKCFTDATTRLTLLAKNNDFAPASKLLVLYRDIVSLKECFQEHLVVNSDFWRSLDIFLGRMVKTMKCVHPRDNVRLPCSTIVTGSESELIYCPVIREEGDLRPMKHLIAERVEKCIMNEFPEDDQFADKSDLDAYRAKFHGFCQKRGAVETCMHSAILTSSVCLNETDHQAIKIVTDILRNVLENGCMNEGVPLAFVTESVLRVDNDTDKQHKRLIPCHEISKTALDNVHSENTTTQKMELYRGLREFRDCFMGKLHGDRGAIFYAQFILNQMLRQLRCMNPENGASVLCQTLDTTSHTGSGNCIFNTNTDSDPLSLSTFIGIGFACVNINEIHPRALDDMTTVGEFKAFIVKYCGIESVIEECLSDLTASSKECLTADEYQKYRIFTTILGDFFKIGCEGEGEAMASLLMAMKKYMGVNEQCKGDAVARWNSISIEQGNTTAASIESFRIVSDFVPCFSNSIPDVEDVKTEISAFMSQLLKRFRCVDVDGVLVSCETIVNDVHGD